VATEEKRPTNPKLVALNKRYREFWDETKRQVERQINDCPEDVEFAVDRFKEDDLSWSLEKHLLALGARDKKRQARFGRRRRNPASDLIEDLIREGIREGLEAPDMWSRILAKADGDGECLEADDGGTVVRLVDEKSGQVVRSIKRSSFASIVSQMRKKIRSQLGAEINEAGSD
jgi:hypothetical protein